MSNQLVISIMADDRPGVVEQVAALVTAHGGNWLESALSRLGGKFAGIVLVEVPAESQPNLETALSALREKGIRAAVDHAGSRTVDGEQMSVDELYTSTESAPMSGELLFRATARVIMPAAMEEERLRTILEELSDDLMVEFFDE